MEFFKNPNVDWMGKAKYFVALSVLLLVTGFLAWRHTGGLLYGIDFRGGTLVYVRFAHTPPLAQIRAALAQEGLGDSTIQQISDPSDPRSKNDAVIGLKELGGVSERLDAGRA